MENSKMENLDTKHMVCCVFILSFQLVLVLGPLVDDKGKARIGYRLAKHVCSEFKTYASTKQIQPPPTKETKYVSNKPCKILRWKYCAKRENCNCEKFTEQDCGTSGSLDERIIGGVEAVPHEFPHQVRITHASNPHCGGVIMNENYVLTAAHCFIKQRGDPYEPQNMVLYLGDHDTRRKERNEITTKIATLTVHEEYHRTKFMNDIALLKVNPPIKMNNDIQPALLPPKDWAYKGKYIASGWGVTASGALSDTLQKVVVGHVTFETCQQQYRGVNEVRRTNLCAASPGKDACKGDSGGPLVVSLDNCSYILAGIVSFGEGCAESKYAGVYTEVSKYIDWINSKAV